MSGEAEHEIYQRRGARNRAVVWALIGLIGLLFVVTMVKMQENVVSPFYEFNNPSVSSDGERLETTSE